MRKFFNSCVSVVVAYAVLLVVLAASAYSPAVAKARACSDCTINVGDLEYRETDSCTFWGNVRFYFYHQYACVGSGYVGCESSVAVELKCSDNGGESWTPYYEGDEAVTVFSSRWTCGGSGQYENYVDFSDLPTGLEYSVNVWVFPFSTSPSEIIDNPDIVNSASLYSNVTLTYPENLGQCPCGEESISGDRRKMAIKSPVGSGRDIPRRRKPGAEVAKKA